MPDRFDDVPAGADSDSSSELDIIEIAPGRMNINCLDEAELRSRGLEEGTAEGSVGIEESTGILPAKYFLFCHKFYFFQCCYFGRNETVKKTRVKMSKAIAF